MSKKNIGKLGIWVSLDNYDFPACIRFAQKAEALGYGAIWLPDALGRDSIATLSALARETQKIHLATGIANIYGRDPTAMVAARKTLDELSGGRLILGIGVSHALMVSDLRKLEYGKPLSTMRSYLDAMDQAIYIGPQPPKQGLLVLAALGEKMLALAGQRADGAHSYLATAEHTARARSIMGPDAFLAPEQKVLLVTDASEARRIARKTIGPYLGLPNYRNSLLSLGFAEEDFEAAGSNRLVDAMVAWGKPDAIQKRIEEHWNNGADHVALQMLRPDGEAGFDPNALEIFASNL
jgi:probable F420-dependent oxidoreductase